MRWAPPAAAGALAVSFCGTEESKRDRAGCPVPAATLTFFPLRRRCGVLACIEVSTLEEELRKAGWVQRRARGLHHH